MVVKSSGLKQSWWWCRNGNGNGAASLSLLERETGGGSGCERRVKGIIYCVLREREREVLACNGKGRGGLERWMSAKLEVDKYDDVARRL